MEFPIKDFFIFCAVPSSWCLLVHLMCKNTKNTKHDRSIGSKQIKYIMFVMLLKKQVMKN